MQEQLIKYATSQDYLGMTCILLNKNYRKFLSNSLTYMMFASYDYYIYSHILHLINNNNNDNNAALNVYIDFFKNDIILCAELISYIVGRYVSNKNWVPLPDISSFISAIVTNKAVEYIKAQKSLNSLFFILYMFRLYDKDNELINTIIRSVIRSKNYGLFIVCYNVYPKINDDIQIKLDKKFEKCTAKVLLDKLI